MEVSVFTDIDITISILLYDTKIDWESDICSNINIFQNTDFKIYAFLFISELCS